MSGVEFVIDDLFSIDSIQIHDSIDSLPVAALTCSMTVSMGTGRRA